jgi:anti-anti-sigma factor
MAMGSRVVRLPDQVCEIAPESWGSEAGLIDRLLDAMLARSTTVVVDLADTPMLSSDALTALRQLGKSMQARGGKVVVRASHPTLVRLMRMTLLTSSFTLEETTDPAHAA